MKIINTSRYDTTEVRDLVTRAVKGIGMSGVQINVKNHNGSIRGRAYLSVPYQSPAYRDPKILNLITLGIGRAFPDDNLVITERWKRVSDEERDRMITEDGYANYDFKHVVHWATNQSYWKVRIRREHPYGGVRSPLIEYRDWREGLVAVAAHEARHIWQYRHGKPMSEVDAERFAAKALDRFRQEEAR